MGLTISSGSDVRHANDGFKRGRRLWHNAIDNTLFLRLHNGNVSGDEV